MFKKFNKIKYNKGVTLIELLVVIFIFVIISGITIFDYGKFRSSLSLQNLADDIALSVRKAQGYAIGVHSESNLFTVGYGVHFSISPTSSNKYDGNNKAFVIFADMGVPESAQDKMYMNNNATDCTVPAVGNECIELLNISGTDTIYGINYYSDGNLYNTTSTSGTLDIVFRRPNPDPIFCYKSDVSHTTCDAGYGSTPDISYVQIILKSVDASPSTKIVEISNNGQISVK